MKYSENKSCYLPRTEKQKKTKYSHTRQLFQKSIHWNRISVKIFDWSPNKNGTTTASHVSKRSRKQKWTIKFDQPVFEVEFRFSLLFHASCATKHNQKVFISATHRRVAHCAGPNRTEPPDSGSGSEYTRAARIRLIEKVKSAISQNRFHFFFFSFRMQRLCAFWFVVWLHLVLCGLHT